MDTSNYQLEDFVTDESFIHWVKSPSEENSAFWNAYISRNPQKRDEIQKARAIILMLDFKEVKADEGKLLSIWENIMVASEGRASVELVPNIPNHNHKQTFIQRFKWMAAAILLLAVSCFYYLSRYAETTVATIYGESRTVFLPDSTKVTLNGNSALTYNANHFNDQEREVWLTGEAFFSVVHKSDNTNFLVHTDELQVEVLGTRFNVNSRRGKTKVVLEEGKVKLNVSLQNERSSVVMKPNDMIVFSDKDKNIIKNEVDPQDYLAWKNNRLIYVATTLEEIAEQLEDNYGYTIVFEDEEIKTRKFTGSTSSEDIIELFDKLEKLFDLNILVNGKGVTIQSLEENPGQHSRP